MNVVFFVLWDFGLLDIGYYRFGNFGIQNIRILECWIFFSFVPLELSLLGFGDFIMLVLGSLGIWEFCNLGFLDRNVSIWEFGSFLKSWNLSFFWIWDFGNLGRVAFSIWDFGNFRVFVFWIFEIIWCWSFGLLELLVFGYLDLTMFVFWNFEMWEFGIFFLILGI